MLSTDGISDIMLEISATGPGEYKVSLSSMHLDWIITCASRTGLSTETVLSLWFGSGIIAMSELCKPLEHPIPPTGEPSGGTMVGDILTVFGVPDLGPEIVFRKGELCEPFEYRCGDCNQLRASFVVSDTCAFCGSRNITKGKPGTLSKEY